MIFKMNECDFGIKYRGVNYDFTHVRSMTIETTRMNRLTRGANAGNKVGLSYTEGNQDPDRLTVVIMDIPIELKEQLDQAFEVQERMDVYCISRKDGSSKMGKNAILCTRPQQLTIDDTPESMNVELIFESFDLMETHKS